MTHASWKQAILISAAVAVLAIAGVATLAWLRRQSIPPVTGARSQATPLLYHDPTGSVYDLHLKMTQLEERLYNAERHSRRLEEEVTRLQSDRDAGGKERAGLLKRLAQTEEQIAALRRATLPPPRTTAPPVAPTNTPASAPAAGTGTDTDGASATEGATPP